MRRALVATTTFWLVILPSKRGSATLAYTPVDARTHAVRGQVGTLPNGLAAVAAVGAGVWVHCALSLTCLVCALYSSNERCQHDAHKQRRPISRSVHGRSANLSSAALAAASSRAAQLQ